MKKALAVLCAICLLLGVTTIVASAAMPEGREANYLSYVDFTNWTEDNYKGFSSKGDWGTAVPSVDENGLLTLTSTNSSYTQYLCPELDLRVIDDETGDVSGAFPGVNIAPFEKSAQIPSDSTEYGICMYVDMSQWEDKVTILWADADYNKDGTPRMKKGEQCVTVRNMSLTLEPDFKGWIKVPFADMTLQGWGDCHDENGFVDLTNLPKIWPYSNVVPGEGVYKIGYIGFYGPMFQPEYQTEGYEFIAGDKMPEDCVVLVDNSKVKTDDGINDGFVVDKEDSKCNIADGFINVSWTPANGGWWFQNGLDTHMIDDETGDLGDTLPGFTTKLDYEYDSTSDNCGLAFYVDTTELTEVNDPFWLDIYLQEAGEKDADGKVIMKKGHEAITTFHIKGFMPIGYKGWIKVPFSKIVQDKWGEQAWDLANQDGKFNADNIVKVTYVASIYGEDAGDAESVTMRIGNLAVWGEGVSKTQPEPEKPVEPETSNPDSGVSAATGIASGVAIAALAVAAAVCFRKKED